MSESPDPSHDAQAEAEMAMRAMMGFSSFSERRPKKQSYTTPMNAPPVATDPKQTASGVPGPSEKHAGDEEQLVSSPHHPLPSSSATTPLPAPPQQTSYAFTSPQTGISYTAAELEEWSRGKVNARGDKVFFKPGFVSDDPWFRLRETGTGGNGEKGSSNSS
ncbi:hypothetical protein AYL99_09641 [Fonsecaea erecta]|uniref:Uncharacterized protein n=1 Tax=Fonsecaea erecta TaxID=1367422 RepID=A0A178Z9W7_9EURO|nr:hypothetical protein AYL99_09641 [Fonsecaea erecta]OAP56462.1 hypothetical protein AYL99_09641 [Fonsecaea erecta]